MRWGHTCACPERSRSIYSALFARGNTCNAASRYNYYSNLSYRITIGEDISSNIGTIYCCVVSIRGGSVAEWLACWTQAQMSWVQIAAATLSGRPNSVRQTVHIHGASVHQTAKLVAALLTVVRVTAGLAESNGSLSPGL